MGKRKREGDRKSLKEKWAESGREFDKHPIKNTAIGCLLPIALVVGFFIFLSNLPDSDSNTQKSTNKTETMPVSTDGMGDAETPKDSQKTTPKPSSKKRNKHELTAKQKDYLDNLIYSYGGVVVEFAPYDGKRWSTTQVIVGNDWHSVSDAEKQKFAETVGKDVHFGLGNKVDLVRFTDLSGNDVAKEKITGGYKVFD